MRLLEIGMGCSVHGGVNGLNTLAVRHALLALSAGGDRDCCDESTSNGDGPRECI